MKTCFAIALCIVNLIGLAQEQTSDFVYLDKRDYIKINNKAGQISANVKVYERAKFMTSNKLFLAKKSIPFDKFRKIENLKAISILENGQKKKVDYFETKDELGGMIFYSDSKRKEFVFPNVKEGTEIEHSYDEVYGNEIPFSYFFNFASYFDTEKAELVIEFPKDVEVDFKLFNADNLDIQFEKKEEKKSTIYIWRTNNIDGIRIDQDNDSDYESRAFYIPHIVVYLKSYLDKEGKKQKGLDKVEDLYQWYSQLISQIDDDDNSEVKDLASELTEGISDKREKAQIIYQWVQSNISYVAFGDGFGGFIPRGASSVCSKKYGDCKDMSHLLFVMLNHVGIDAYHAWVGSRNKPYTYEENPTPYVDDHMISLAIIGNDSIFLDGTDSFVDFGYPSSFTQGKEALVGFDKTTAFIKKVPIVPYQNNTIKVETEASLSEGRVIVQEDRILIGLEKTSFVSAFSRNNGKSTDEEFLNTKLELGNNKTRYTNILLEGLNNISSELTLSYDLIIEDYYREIGDRIFINMNFDRKLSEESVDIDGRKYGKKFDNKFEIQYTTSLTIPDGYSLKSIPEKSNYDKEKFGYEITYIQKDQKVVQSKKIYLNTLHVSPDEFQIWNDFIQNLVSEYKKNLVFVRNN